MALRLLTTVAKHSSAAARLLYTGVTFIREETQALYNESGAHRLRKPFIELLLALVTNAAPPILKAILDDKGELALLLLVDYSELIGIISWFTVNS